MTSKGVKIYAVLFVNRKAKVKSPLGIQDIELSWHEGQVGAIPVFEKLSDAESVSCGKFEIIELIK